MSDNTQELREKLESLILVHKLANWDKNLGQYKSEHKCQCGYTFIVDGHIADSSVPVKMAEHISVQLEALIKSQTNQAVVGANKVTGETSDGYHTFNELYHYRMLYNALYVNELVKRNPYAVHKSKRHSDGELAFGGGWFVVTMDLPTGQVTNHYELKDWDKFHCAELDKAPEWDGHTPQEAAERMEATLRKELTQETKK